jgi:hypothetical protein
MREANPRSKEMWKADGGVRIDGVFANVSHSNIHHKWQTISRRSTTDHDSDECENGRRLEKHGLYRSKDGRYVSSPARYVTKVGDSSAA